MIASCNKSSCLPLCLGSQTYVFYPKKTQGGLAHFPYLQEIEMPANSVFVRIGYLDHAG